MCALALGPLQTHSLIGREKEQKIIRTAVQAAGLRVIFIIGQPGMGKTRLLEEIPTIQPQAACADLIDLYHTDVHTISGIEQKMINSLDPDGRSFTEYRQKRQHFEQMRQAGITGPEFETLHAELGSQFIQDLNSLAEKQRVVLRFDTVELVQREQEIHPLLEQQEEVAEVRGWLTRRIPDLCNAVVIMAGRPYGTLWEDLKKELGESLKIVPNAALPNGWQDAPLLEIELGPLAESDVPSYFEDLAAENANIRQNDLTSDHYATIYGLTQGRPLHLAFIATLLARRDKMPDELLVGLEQGSSVLNTRQLLEQVLNLTPDLNVALPFVARLRQGAESTLLYQIMTKHLGDQWTLVRIEAVLDDLRGLPFAKTRSGNPRVWLHDEMYDLMDKWILNQPVKAGEQELTYRIALEWYEKKIQVEEGKVKQNLIVEHLYYYLSRNPEEGFGRYQDLSDEALIGREIGFEMSLRDQVLRFLQAHNLIYKGENLSDNGRRVARDIATRWVQRLLRQAKHVETLDLIDRIWGHNQYPFERDGAYLFPCVLLAYKGEAQAYLGQIQAAIQTLEEAIQRLNQLTEKPDTRRASFRQYLLGLVHKNLGYVYARQHDYEQAVWEDETAKTQLEPLAQKGRRAGQLELANVQRNLAFVYSEQGLLDQARDECTQALTSFQYLGYRWAEALTLNVFGSIEYRFHHLKESLEYCQSALSIFTDIQDRRGIGLSALRAGRARRKLSAAHPYTRPGQRQTELEQAKEDLAQACRIFQEIGEQPRLIEAIAEQGKLYRDWATVLRREEQDEAQIQTYTQQAKTLFSDAIQRADERGMTTERADYRHDLADLYVSQGDYISAQRCLDQAEQCVDQACVLSPAQSLPELQCPLPGYLEIMAKICASRGHLAWENSHTDAIEQWALAFAYLRTFSPTSGRFGEEIADDIARKWRDLPLQELKRLRGHCRSIHGRLELPSSLLLDKLDQRIKMIERKEQVSYGAL